MTHKGPIHSVGKSSVNLIKFLVCVQSWMYLMDNMITERKQTKEKLYMRLPLIRCSGIVQNNVRGINFNQCFPDVREWRDGGNFLGDGKLLNLDWSVFKMNVSLRVHMLKSDPR